MSAQRDEPGPCLPAVRRRMPLRLRRRAPGLLATGLLLSAAACGGSADSADSGAEGDASGAATLTPLWSLEDVRPVSHPVAVDGSVVVLVAGDDGVDLAAYDAGTGEVRWRVPSAAPGVTVVRDQAVDAVSVRPVVAGEAIVHLVPGDQPGEVRMQAVGADDGEALWRTERSEPAMLWPEACDDEGRSVCLVVPGPDPEMGGPARVPTLWAVDVVDGVTDRQISGTPAGGFGGDPLPGDGATMASVRSGDQAVERRLHAGSGEELWALTWEELFGGGPAVPDPSAEGRVLWDGIGDVLIAAAGVRPAEPWPDDGARGLIPWVTSGVDAASGDVLWTVPGGPYCGRVNDLLLEVAGLGPVDGEIDADTVVRCAVDGTAERASGEDVSFDSDVTVAAIDVAGGDARWSVELEHFDDLLGEGRAVRLGPTTFGGELGDGSFVAVDLATGERRAADASEVGWCLDPNELPAASGSSGPGTAVRGADLTVPCDLRGERQDAPGAADPGLGALVGGTFVWMDGTGLHAATSG